MRGFADDCLKVYKSCNDRLSNNNLRFYKSSILSFTNSLQNKQ